MDKKNITIFSLAALLVACSDEKPGVVSEKPSPPKAVISQPPPKQVAIDTTSATDGPPFADTCLCSFDAIGHLRTSQTRYDLFLSGKGWNPKFESCDWTWGEVIGNEPAPDTLVTDFRVHLIDLKEFKTKPKSAFLSSDDFNKNLIMTYIRTGNEKDTIIYNPNRPEK